MKRIVVFFAIIIAITLAYWLISPLFFNETVDESLDEFVASEPAGFLPADSMAAYEKEMDAANAGGDVVMNESLPSAQESDFVASGSFVSVAHEGSGTAKLLKLGDSYIVRFEDFKVLNGPDLRVLVSKNPSVTSSSDLGEYIELGKLKGNIGTQHYALPQTWMPEDTKSVIIYCKPFHVVFTSAELKAGEI